MIKCFVLICRFEESRQCRNVQCSVPGWCVNCRAHLWPRFSFGMSRHFTATGISAPLLGFAQQQTMNFSLFAVERFFKRQLPPKVLTVFTERCHTFGVCLWNLFFLAIEPASVVGKHQHEDMIPLAYWMYQNTEPDIQVSAEFSPCAFGWIYLLIAGIFWKEGLSRMCVPPSPGRNRYSRWGWRWEEASCDEREKGKGIGNRRARLRREG